MHCRESAYFTPIIYIMRVFTVAFWLALLGLWGCSKQTETFSTATIADYYPIEVGDNYVYRLDSTVRAPFGTSLVVKSYHAKDSVESTFIDNGGRLSYRIFRMITDTLEAQPWQPAATLIATPTANGLETVDNNLRYINLKLPIREWYTWKGNSFIDTRSLSSTVTYLDGWDYQYQDVDQPFTGLSQTYDSTITVFQHNETSPDGPFDPSAEIQVHISGKEVYAKGVGLVLKEFLYWNWQKNPGPPHFEDGSYGVRLQLLRHY